MLSDVMLPPQPPHPSVIEGSREVVNPIDPRVVGVLTTIRNAGFFRPNCEDHVLVARVDRHRVAHPAVSEDLLAPLAALLPVADDIEGQDRTELLDRQRVVTSDARQFRDQHARAGGQPQCRPARAM